MLSLLLLLAKPTRVKFFGAILVRPRVTYFDGVCSLLSKKDCGMLCFSMMLTVRNMMDSSFFSCSFEGYHFFSCCNLFSKSLKTLENVKYPHWCCFKMFTGRSSWLCSLLTFYGIKLCQRCFPRYFFVCHSSRHLKLFWPQHFQSLLGAPACCLIWCMVFSMFWHFITICISVFALWFLFLPFCTKLNKNCGIFNFIYLMMIKLIHNIIIS